MNNAYRTTCVIVSNGDGKPKKWSLIKYTISVNMRLSFGGGATTMPIPNVQAVTEWPDDPVDIQPAAIGSSHPYVVTEGFGEAFITEFPAMANCPAPPTGTGGIPQLTGGGIVRATTTGGGNTSGTQGSQGGQGSGDGSVGVPPR